MKWPTEEEEAATFRECMRKVNETIRKASCLQSRLDNNPDIMHWESDVVDSSYILLEKIERLSKRIDELEKKKEANDE